MNSVKLLGLVVAAFYLDFPFFGLWKGSPHVSGRNVCVRDRHLFMCSETTWLGKHRMCTVSGSLCLSLSAVSACSDSEADRFSLLSRHPFA